MVIFIGRLVGILMLKTLDLLIRLHLFGDYYAWSAANDVKRVQTGYIKNFRYSMTTRCGILLLVDEDVIVEAENSETKLSNGFGRNRHPAKTCPKPAKNYQISPLPLFNSLFSQEKAMYCRIWLDSRIPGHKNLKTCSRSPTVVKFAYRLQTTSYSRNIRRSLSYEVKQAR